MRKSLSSWVNCRTWLSRKTSRKGRLTINLAWPIAMDKNAGIYLADNHGLVGRAIAAWLKRNGFRFVFGETGTPRLTDAKEVDAFFSGNRPEYVFLIGGTAGGIRANQKMPADLILDNLLANAHVIESARRHGIKKLLYLASSCIYPKFCRQPMRPEYLMTGKLEPTNEPYAVAKLAGIFLCQAYRQQYKANFTAAITANVFGPGDDFSEENSHVIGALIRRMHEAKVTGRSRVIIWGSGSPRREFIFSEDLAEACIFLMNHYDGEEPINTGVGFDCSIRDIADMIKEVVGYPGELVFDTSKPDGMPAKLLDSGRLHEMGWEARTPIREGLAATYQWFLRKGEPAEVKNEQAIL